MKENKRLTLLRKQEIAKFAENFNAGRKKMKKKFGITEGQAKTILKIKKDFISVYINPEENLKKIPKNLKTNEQDLDKLALEYIKSLRK